MFDFGQTSLYSDPLSRIDPVIEALSKAIDKKTFTGVVYQMMGGLMAPLKDPEYKVMSRSKSTRNGTIEAAWAASGATGLAIPAQYLNGLSVSHVLKIGGEIVVIEKVNRPAGTIDVFARGMSGTTAAAHAAGSAFEVIGIAGRDGDLENVESVSEHTIECINYAQTVFEVTNWQKMASLPNREGLASGSLVDMERIEAAIRMSEKLSYMAIHSVKNKGSANQPYMTSGLLASLADDANGSRPTKVYSCGKSPITETMLCDALDDVFEHGSPDTIILSTGNARKFKAFVGAGDQAIQVLVNTDRSDTGAGRWVNHYNYNGASLELLIDRDMPNDKIAVVTKSDLKKGWLETDPLRLETEPTTSSRKFRESLQGSIGFLVENVGYNHILIDGVAL